MDVKIRNAQYDVLAAFTEKAGTFSLAGGTALELYCLHHRFSRNLDFFSPVYNVSEIDRLLPAIRKETGTTPKLESELSVAGKAEVRFYTMPIRGSKRPPLHLFLKTISPVWRKGLVHWYQTFSRHDFKLSLLDLEMYDQPIESRRVIRHLDGEIQKFINEVVNG